MQTSHLLSPRLESLGSEVLQTLVKTLSALEDIVSLLKKSLILNGELLLLMYVRFCGNHDVWIIVALQCVWNQKRQVLQLCPLYKHLGSYCPLKFHVNSGIRFPFLPRNTASLIDIFRAYTGYLLFL